MQHHLEEYCKCIAPDQKWAGNSSSAATGNAYVLKLIHLFPDECGWGSLFWSFFKNLIRTVQLMRWRRLWACWMKLKFLQKMMSVRNFFSFFLREKQCWANTRVLFFLAVLFSKITSLIDEFTFMLSIWIKIFPFCKASLFPRVSQWKLWRRGVTVNFNIFTTKFFPGLNFCRVAICS